ncbi:calcineurin phosphoesterase [Fusarium longipes]|uniref:Calcineurin phosphoesterase n=1 Tax=Fusarium longipes TaxID=694270 RepID=A0A395SXG4_9HYPO|nr:calcineurin phosphoesterase [Fusarium longipes]
MTTQDAQLDDQLCGLQLSSSDSATAWYRLETHVQDVELTGRIIIVGDVHGHLPELKDLLQKVAYDKKNGDQLIFVGDLINKGPDSPGVVQLAMDLDALSIRGNNEDRVLAAYSAINRGDDSKFIGKWRQLALEAEKNQKVEKPDADQPVAAAPKDELRSLSREDLKPYMAESDFATATSLSAEQITWLASQPLILRIKLPKENANSPWNAGTLIVAHGGLVPLVPLEEQDPWAVMNMRSLVYPDAEASLSETVKADMIKGATSRVRRYAAFQNASDDEVKVKLTDFADFVKNGQGFTQEQKDGLIGFPLENRDGDWWIDAWNRWQNSIEDYEQRSIVVYGHDARVGLQVGTQDSQVARYTFGLDSGCVYGRSLSAMVVGKNTNGGLAHEIGQVDAIKKAEDKPEGSA